MTEWIDFSVYAAMIVALWFVLPMLSSRFTLRFVADRNPEWLSSHPEVATKLTGGGWLRWVPYAWGVLSLAVLLIFQADLWPQAFGFVPEEAARWETLKDLNSTLLLPGILYFVGAGALFTWWLQKAVPRADRRQATLERRSIDDFVPRWLRFATYSLIGAVLLAWLVVGVFQLYSTPIFWPRFALLAAMTAAFAFFVRLGVNRSPNPMDRVFGPGFRAGEVRYGFAMHFLPPVIGVVRLYEEVANVTLVDINRAMHVGVALIVAVWGLRLARYFRPGHEGDGAQRPFTATSSTS